MAEIYFKLNSLDLTVGRAKTKYLEVGAYSLVDEVPKLPLDWL